MKTRCDSEKCKEYPNYGGRGIYVCDRWKNSFENFLADVGYRASERFTIERIDVNGHYEPGNCEWVLKTEQNRNKRNTVYVTYKGKKTKLLDVILELGISRAVVQNRLALGWPLEVAMAAPLRTRYKGAGREHIYKRKKMRRSP
jgi:hypothetical protein